MQVLAICREADVACYFHSQPQLAVKLNAQGIHLPLKMAASMSCEDRMRLPCLGISVHSKKEAVEARNAKEGVEQLKAYMSACLNCEWGMCTKNGCSIYYIWAYFCDRL